MKIKPLTIAGFIVRLFAALLWVVAVIISGSITIAYYATVGLIYGQLPRRLRQ